MTDRILTVTQLNDYVAAILNGDPMLRALKVQGEISGFKRHSSGHLYFMLKDENAVIRCVMFRSAALTLRFAPQDGMHVIVDGYASLYTRDGQFQLYAQAMQKEGEGELYKRFLLLKARLEAMGYFDAARKRPIPALPRCVGVITSPTGAAVQDIIEIIRRRFPSMDIQFCPAQVQGTGAAEDIADAVRRMNGAKRASVLIVGRGGGSIEDLWAFNEPAVVKAIYESTIPVVSAVGHETDFTLADFTADLRAPTPSAAAELCVPEYAVLLQRADELASVRLPRAMLRSVAVKRERVELLLRARGFSLAGHNVSILRERLKTQTQKLSRLPAQLLREQRNALQGTLNRLASLSPGAVLARGFAIVSDAEGRLLGEAGELSKDMEILLRMRDGTARARIEDVAIGNNPPERSRP